MTTLGIDVFQINKSVRFSTKAHLLKTKKIKIEFPDYFEQGKYTTRVEIYDKNVKMITCIKFKADFIDLDLPEIDL